MAVLIERSKMFREHQHDQRRSDLDGHRCQSPVEPDVMYGWDGNRRMCQDTWHEQFIELE